MRAGPWLEDEAAASDATMRRIPPARLAMCQRNGGATASVSLPRYSGSKRRCAGLVVGGGRWRWSAGRCQKRRSSRWPRAGQSDGDGTCGGGVVGEQRRDGAQAGEVYSLDWARNESQSARDLISFLERAGSVAALPWCYFGPLAHDARTALARLGPAK